LQYTILWTITGYPRTLEPNAEPLDSTIEYFLRTAEKIGSSRIVWRYDPIVITPETGPEWHIQNFSRIAEAIGRNAHRVIVSMMTPYSSVVRRMRNAGIEFDESPLARDDVHEMLVLLPEIARENGVGGIQACCQSGALVPFGIPDGACISASWLNSALGTNIVAQKDTGQRKECLCTHSIDIGAYDTCPRGCIYCYAVKNAKSAAHFLATHNPQLEWLK